MIYLILWLLFGLLTYCIVWRSENWLLGSSEIYTGIVTPTYTGFFINLLAWPIFLTLHYLMMVGDWWDEHEIFQVEKIRRPLYWLTSKLEGR